jgi:hypothetical protein
MGLARKGSSFATPPSAPKAMPSQAVVVVVSSYRGVEGEPLTPAAAVVREANLHSRKENELYAPACFVHKEQYQRSCKSFVGRSC